MSFQVFKTNMSLWMQTPDKLATGNAESYQDFADKLTAEYDIAVKSGYQTINLVRVSKGNTELMKSLITIACLTALNKQEGKHNFIDEIGKAVLGYLTGCQLTSGIPPLLPAFGAMSNVDLWIEDINSNSSSKEASFDIWSTFKINRGIYS